MPHGYCYQWDAGLVGLHVVSDALITLSYYSIPLALLYFVRRRRDLEFSWMFLCFAVFIVACGTSHLLEIWTVWRPAYWLSGAVKAVTALASIPTAILLVTTVVPAALLVPSSAMLRKKNDELASEVSVRKQAQEELAEKAEALQRSNRDLQQFAYVASHDLREPLRAVSSYCELLREDYQGKLSPEADQYIGFAVEGAQRMERLVSDLLAYAQVSAGEAKVQRVELTQTVERAKAALALMIAESQAEITSGALPAVRGDPVLLAQLLQNLLANALKFRGDQRPRVEITATVTDGVCTVSVRDEGIGIAPEFRQKIFQMFQRLNPAAYPGTGIGLTVCQRIVERHGGKLWVESELGKGATFYFSLPVHE